MNTCEPNVNRSISYRQVRRIGLISPCAGNLGNAAIMSAMITNIRERVAGVEILGITLSPDDTRRRHGIEAFPITGSFHPGYSVCNPEFGKVRSRHFLQLGRIKEWSRRVPWLRRVLRAVGMCGKELAHIVAAARVVRKLDRVMVTGGGALDEFWGGPWGHPWTLLKWALLSRMYRVPFSFVSVGKCSLEHRLSRLFVRIALRLAEYRSYRDSGSKIAVQALIDARKDRVEPDLAFSYPCPFLTDPGSCRSPGGGLVVGVSPIAYLDPRSWPLKDGRRFAAYLGQLVELVKWLIRERHRVLLFATDNPDVPLIAEIEAMVSNDLDDTDAIELLPGPPGQSTDGLLEGISHADLIIASRLHGVILAHLTATPVLALSYDPKVTVYMDAIGQMRYCLDIDDFSVGRVVERFNALKVARRQEAARLRTAALLFRGQLNAQYDRILGARGPHCVRDSRSPIKSLSWTDNTATQ